MFWYELASKNLAYYHTLTSLPSGKIAFKIPNQLTDKPKKKNLFGKHLDVGKWHYAMSVRTSLHPFLGFDLKNHLLFSKTGYKAIEDKDLQQLHRRKKGRRMFNEEWRDLQLAFINSLKDKDGFIRLQTGVERPITLKNTVETFTSAFGYFDPKDLERQGLFVQEEREDINDETD